MRTVSLANLPFGHPHRLDNASYGAAAARPHRLRAALPHIAREIDGAANVAANDWRGVLTVYVAAFAATLTFIL